MNSDKELDVGLKSRSLAHLRRVCGRYGVVLGSYVLTGVAMDEPAPRKTSVIVETWRGIDKGKPIAIKVFKIAEDCEGHDKIRTVRRIAPTIGNVVVLIS